MYEDIRSLENCESEFVEYLKFQAENCSDRNREWFPKLLDNYNEYLLWTVCFQNDKIVAFSAIQSHYFPENIVRILTRTYFDKSIRLPQGYDFWAETPVAPMANYQIDWLRKNNKYERALITMESRHRLDYFSKIIDKINTRTNSSFKVLEDPVKTHKGQPRFLYHHAAELNLKE